VLHRTKFLLRSERLRPRRVFLAARAKPTIVVGRFCGRGMGALREGILPFPEAVLCFISVSTEMKRKRNKRVFCMFVQYKTLRASETYFSLIPKAERKVIKRNSASLGRCSNLSQRTFFKKFFENSKTLLKNKLFFFFSKVFGKVLRKPFFQKGFPKPYIISLIISEIILTPRTICSQLGVE